MICAIDDHNVKKDLAETYSSILRLRHDLNKG